MDLRNRRVAIVGPLPPPAGGMANQTRQLAELLRGEGAEVEIVQVNAPYRPEWIGGVRGVRAVFRLVPYFLRLVRAARRCDLFHVMANSGWAWHLFAAPAIWVAWLFRVPSVVNYRGGYAADFLSRSARVVRWTMSRAAVLAVPSGFLQAVFREHGMSARVLPNIVDLERFRPGRADSGDVRRGHVVVARNLETIYGVDLALRAFARLAGHHPDARLSIAGTGPELGRLENLAGSLGVRERVTFTGRLDRDEMANLYRSAHLVLNPVWVDNMPNSVLEALASGVPVVSTNVGGVPYLVTDERTALLVPPGDVEAMAAAMLRVLDDEVLRVALRDAGLQEVRRYAWPEVRHELLALYGCGRRASDSTVGAS